MLKSILTYDLDVGVAFIYQFRSPGHDCVAQKHKSATVNVTGCGFDFQCGGWVLVYFYPLALVENAMWNIQCARSAIEHTMPPEFGGKWGMEV